MALVIDATLYLSGLRLLGIGRNQYIDLMNQCRSSKVRKKKSTLWCSSICQSFHDCAAMLMKCVEAVSVSLRVFCMKIVRWSFCWKNPEESSVALLRESCLVDVMKFTCSCLSKHLSPTRNSSVENQQGIFCQPNQWRSQWSHGG